MAKKSSTKNFINILMNLSLTPTIYCGRIKLQKMLRLTVAVFYDKDKALTVTVRALNNVYVYFKNNLWNFVLSSYTKI